MSKKWWNNVLAFCRWLVLKDDLYGLQRRENGRFSWSRIALYEWLPFFQGLLDLQRELNKSITNVNLGEHSDAIKLYLMVYRKHLSKGSLSLLRGHLTDCFLSLRSSIEIVAFAALVKTDPRLANQWLSAWEDDQSYRLYKSQFSAKSIFKASNPLLKDLSKRYDYCSRLCHPSIYAVYPHFNFLEEGPKTKAKLEEFEININKNVSDQPVLLMILQYFIETNLCILRLFREVISSGNDDWEKNLMALASSFEEQKRDVQEQVVLSLRAEYKRLFP
jgi:hypothetical protein